MYLNLNSDMKFVKGEKRSIIHSLLNGRVFYFEKEYKLIIEELLDGASLKKVELVHGTDKLKEIMKYIEDNTIGNFFKENNVFNPTIKIHSGSNIFQERIEKFSMDSITIKITSRCNLNCIFCIKDSHLNAPCMCCRNKETFETNIYIYDIIKQAEKLGIKEVHLIGGEPFLRLGLVVDIAEKLYEKNIQLVVHTNGVLLKEKDVIILEKLNVFCLLNVYTYNSIKEYEVTGIRGYTEKLKNILYYFNKYKLQYEIDWIIGKYNVREEIKELGSTVPISKKYILPPNGYSIFKDSFPILKMGNTAIGIANYERAEQRNLCLSKGIYVDVDGEIYPCKGLDSAEHSLGNVQEAIYKIFRNEKYKYYWNASNALDYVCGDCAERLMCVNCKAYKMQYKQKDYMCPNKV